MLAVHTVGDGGTRTPHCCHEELQSFEEKKIRVASFGAQAAFQWNIEQFV